MFGADEPWLWRGQANAAYALEPAMHTRVRRNAELDDDRVLAFTNSLISAAKAAALDHHEGTKLPDLALLALLQHHGAATPLLDVSLDPLVGLYMATVSPNLEDDGKDGALFAIRRPRPEQHISDFDSRRFNVVYEWIGYDVALYSAPDISERLRIQRGHFLIGPVSDTDPRATIPLSIDTARPADRWLHKRMKRRGKTGPPIAATSDVATFRITAKFKSRIREWLEARSGLTRDFVYPTPWHQPHLDRFAAAHGRRASF
jgi:hypothetical protein